MPTLTAEQRNVFGKKLRELRMEGKLPAVLYGAKLKEALPLTITNHSFEQLWKQAGESTIIDLIVEGGKTRKVLIHDVGVDPVKNKPVHVDFYEVDAAKPLHVRVPIRFVGEALAEKTLGGVLLKQLHEIEIESLPKDLPYEVVADLSKLKTFDSRLKAADLQLPDGVRVKGEDNVIVALVEPPKTQAQLDEDLEEKPADIDFEGIEKVGEQEKEAKTKEAKTEAAAETSTGASEEKSKQETQS